MVSKFNYVTQLNEYFYFYLSLFKLFNFCLIKIEYKFISILKFKLNNFNFINKFLNYKINYRFNLKQTDNNLFIKNSQPNQINFLKKNLNIFSKFFHLFFLFNFSLFNTNFKFNYNFKLFYVYFKQKKVLILNIHKFLIRWKEAYDLLFNIFFYNFNPLFFSSNFFKNETLSLNWNYNTFDINLWKYYFPFFTLKLNNYNKKTDFFFSKLFFLKINFFLITDCEYHYKNIHYMQKNNGYTIGLINFNLNPWLVSYPIISFLENFLVQLFFFKFIIFIEKHVILFKFNILKQYWINLLFFTKLI